MPSDRIGYGYGPYGDADWGVEGVSKTASAAFSASAALNARVDRVINSASVINVAGSLNANAVVEYESGVDSIDAVSTVSDFSAERVRDVSATSVADSGTLYGYGDYGSGDFSVASVFAFRVRTTGGSADALSSFTGAAKRIQQPQASFAAVASLAADSDTIVTGQGILAGAASLEVNTKRIRQVDSTIQATGDLDASGREKWEPIAETPEIWTRID